MPLHVRLAGEDEDSERPGMRGARERGEDGEDEKRFHAKRDDRNLRGNKLTFRVDLRLNAKWGCLFYKASCLHCISARENLCGHRIDAFDRAKSIHGLTFISSGSVADLAVRLDFGQYC